MVVGDSPDVAQLGDSTLEGREDIGGRIAHLRRADCGDTQWEDVVRGRFDSPLHSGMKERGDKVVLQTGHPEVHNGHYARVDLGCIRGRAFSVTSLRVDVSTTGVLERNR